MAGSNPQDQRTAWVQAPTFGAVGVQHHNGLVHRCTSLREPIRPVGQAFVSHFHQPALRSCYPRHVWLAERRSTTRLSDTQKSKEGKL